ncbi:MAG: STY0301 family protein [Caulobacteraceae bacterium]
MPNHRLSRNRALAAALSGAAVSLWSAGASAATPACPASLDVVEAPAAVPAGFRAYLNGGPPARAFGKPAAHRLDAIMFSDGPPDQMAWLAPTASGKGAQRWDFTHGAGAATWLSCGYLATSVIVSIPLPASTRSCRVTYDTAASPPVARRLACR